MATLQNGGAGSFIPVYEGIKPKHKKLAAYEGTNMVKRESLEANLQIIQDGQKAMRELSFLISRPCKNAHKQLQLYRHWSRKLIEYQFLYQDLLSMANCDYSRILESTQERSRKRWTKEEDELLVDLAADHEMSAMEIATKLGRSPGAITTRLSYLVGIGQLEQSIAGHFIGWLDGEHVSGAINGELRKEQR